MNPNLFPSFHDFDPSDYNFHCIAHTKYPDKRRCRNPLGTTRARAQQVRDEIMGSKKYDLAKLDLRLEEYARMCCCTRWHRDMVAATDCIDRLVQRWKRELIMDKAVVDIKQEQPFGLTGQKQFYGIKVEEVLLIEYNAPAKQRQIAASSSSILQAPSRYDLRSQVHRNSSWFTNENTKSITATHNFIPYRTTLKYDALREKFLEPLGPSSLATGTLYLYTRSCDPGFVKIGYTTQAISQRMAQWRRECHYDPIVKHSISNVPNVHRAERLVHIVIAEYRRRETICKTNPCCSKSHMEWFEIDLQLAVQVMNKVAQFMQTERPYGSDAMLTKTWRNYAMVHMGELKLDDLIAHQRYLSFFSSSSSSLSSSSSHTTPMKCITSSASASNINGIPSTPIKQEKEDDDDEEEEEDKTLLEDDDEDDDEDETLLNEDDNKEQNPHKLESLDPIKVIETVKDLVDSKLDNPTSVTTTNTTTTTTTVTPPPPPTSIIQVAAATTTTTEKSNPNNNSNKPTNPNLFKMTPETKALMTQLLNLLKKTEKALAKDRLMLERKDIWGDGDGNTDTGRSSSSISMLNSESRTRTRTMEIVA